MTEPRSLGPVRESERIKALDVARGVALIGIFLVNINTFGEAFGYFIQPGPRDDRGPYEWICWVLGRTFWEQRFYSMFSMLFGMGLVIQYWRAKAAGRSYAGPMARRLIVLALIGMSHALLLWYGDILFLYGVVGLLMIVFVRFSPKTLCIIAGSISAATLAIATGFGLLDAAFSSPGSGPQTTSAAIVSDAPAEVGGATTKDVDAVPGADVAPVTAVEVVTGSGAMATEVVSDVPNAALVGEGPFTMWLRELRSGTIGGGPDEKRWIELETRAYRDGPWLESFGFRASSWVMFIVMSFMFFGWQVLALFCFGAALMKWDFFNPSRRRWHVGLVIASAAIFVPLSFATAVFVSTSTWKFAGAIGGAVFFITGPLMALGYLSAITLIVRHGILPLAASVVAAAGRMAFTNYLMQTVLATAIFYHWGLGLFDSTTRLERIGMVLGIYAFQLAFSVCWLKVFAMGPLEWLWRTATYLRFPPLLRREASTEP